MRLLIVEVVKTDGSIVRFFFVLMGTTGTASR